MLAIFTSISEASTSKFTVKTTVGSFNGRISGTGSRPVLQYLGIPYAEPPTGQYRFQKPREKASMGEFDALSYGPACFTNDRRDARGWYSDLNLTFNEDCLSLNIFVPYRVSVLRSGKENVTKLPVMVWIHGGSFRSLSSSFYDPSAIVTGGNVIVVTVNYRLGVFGFFSTGDKNALGNYGLWDQHLALQWISKHISKFGGMSDSITIFGESAGAAAVGYQIISNCSRGLFHRAILQSGSPIAPWAINRNPRSLSFEFGNQLGCDMTHKKDGETLLICLRNASTRDIMKSAALLTVEHSQYGIIWVPTIDNDFVYMDPQHIMHDLNYLKDKSVYYDIDILIGVNNREGSVFNPHNNTILMLMKTPSIFKNIILSNIMDRTFSCHTKEALDLAADMYLTPARLNNRSMTTEELYKADGDLQISLPTIRFGLNHQLPGNKSTYLYYFDHYPTYNPLSRGITHGGDLPYVFNSFDLMKTFNLIPPCLLIPSEEKVLSREVILYWTNFAKTGYV